MSRLRSAGSKAKLAERANVTASTQNQALCALLFLYRHVLDRPLGPLAGVAWAKKGTNVPVVLSRDEVAAVLDRLRGVMWLIAVVLYGAGLRISECLDLRVKDIDFDRRQIVVRDGKGAKDRRQRSGGGSSCSRRRAFVGTHDGGRRAVQELLGHKDVSTTMSQLWQSGS